MALTSELAYCSKMVSKWILIPGLVLCLQVGFALEPVIKEAVVHSPVLGADRAFHVYLPASYQQEPPRRYPVLYVQDGQNIFSTAGTNVAFGWGSWQLDRTADELARAHKMQEIIMVAVDNSADRMGEYDGRSGLFPTNGATAGERTPFDNYAQFLIEELKPQIDREYRTRPDAADTAVMGSSLGGICSVVLAWEHPNVFGGAASLSGSFQVEHTNFLNEVLGKYHGAPKPIRIYVDSGTVSFHGGDDNHALNEEVAAQLRRIGWTTNFEYYTDEKPLTLDELKRAGLRRDKWDEAQTSQHNEFYWRLRAWRALTFLFPPDKN